MTTYAINDVVITKDGYVGIVKEVNEGTLRIALSERESKWRMARDMQRHATTFEVEKFKKENPNA